MNFLQDRIVCNHIGLAHFNNKTYNENIKWKEKKNFNGCVYGFQQFLPENIPADSDVYMIDMNNDTNQIMGIGLIKKQFRPENRSRIYDNMEYNRIVIKSPYYRDRKFLLDKNSTIVEFIENILFKGYSHLKRSSNMTLSYERLAYAPPIGTPFKTKKKKKRIYKCSICGLPKKGHNNCPGKRVEPIRPKYKNCNLCGKSLKGHSGYRPCESKKRNIDNIKKVLIYLEKLFI